LWRGFASDDFERVPTTWEGLLRDPLRLDGRPVEMLSFALLPDSAVVHHTASLAIYLACIAMMWLVCRRFVLAPWPTFLAVSSFFHPAFLWGVTWIAQRTTVIVVFFLLAALAARRIPARLAMIAIGSGVRTPYVFQNLVFSWQFLRQRQVGASLISFGCLLAFVVAGYLTYYDRAAATDTLANSSIPSVVSLPLRLVKLLEGVFYVFAPIPMFAAASWGPVLALAGYAACWIVIARSLQPVRRDTPGLMAMAAAMCIPFVFASEVRVAGEAAVMTFLAIASALPAEWRRSARIAAVCILVLNLTGIMLNYGLFASQQFDIRGTPVYSDLSAPVSTYRARREELRRQVFDRLGVATSERTFE
jgi:hypothetical protein